MTAGGRDLVWAGAVGTAALCVYLRTLAPGMVAVLDTPMFQFIGRVLGVPHNPGYPLYVLLTYPFSFLPIGSLAYRINLFSALCGALTVGLTFLLARELGCRRVISAAAVLALAFAHVFWSQSIIAEVYTLDTAIIAGMLLALLVWGRTGRPGLFYASIALFAAGLGNHTTIVGFAPGMAIYAWMVNRAFLMRARTMLVSAGILACGVLQYAFVLVRSRQDGVYVESPARTLGELAAAMSGRQFGDRLFAFTWQQVVFERVPWLVERLLVPELTMPALVLAVIGAVWLSWRRLSAGLLLSTAVLAIAGFTINYSVVDSPVFLIPATTMLWVLAAVGAECVVSGLERRWSTAGFSAIVMLALPAWLLAVNYAITDRRHDTSAAVSFDALFETLPDRSLLVREDFLVDRMVMFKLLGDRAAGERHIELAGRDSGALARRFAEGAHVFGFAKSVRALRHDGLDFSYAPVALLGGDVGEHLARLPKGSVVAIAVPGGYAETFVSAANLAAIGVPPDSISRRKGALGILGVVGAASGGTVVGEPLEAGLEIEAGKLIGETGVASPLTAHIRAQMDVAAIRQRDRDIVWTRDGAAMAVWNAAGRLQQTFRLQALDEFRVPVPPGPLSVYPLRGSWRRLEIGAEWKSATAIAETGSLMFEVRGGDTATVLASSEYPLAPRAIDQSSGDVGLRVERIDAQALDAERLPRAVDVARSAHVYRIAVEGRGTNAVTMQIALGGIPTGVAARIAGRESRGALRSINTSGLLRVRDRSTEVLLMARDEQSQLTGDGWSNVDWDEVSAFRWMTRNRAHLVLPISRDGLESIHVSAFRDQANGPDEMRLILDGRDLGARPVRPGWHTYEWVVPRGSVPSGTSVATLVVDRLPGSPSPGQPPQGLAVAELRAVFQAF